SVKFKRFTITKRIIVTKKHLLKVFINLPKNYLIKFLLQKLQTHNIDDARLNSKSEFPKF
ncbi:MAG: hypothetical protein LBP59_20130, partial [Planctomycetaceae bacterium]|nr:hypothetical protein [Planctomycetaceae bacterium]